MSGQLSIDTRDASWFALRVKPNHEKSVARAIEFQGYEGFLPTYRVRRATSPRSHEIDHALFAGYVFCRFGRASWARIINTPGVIDVVRSGRTLAAIDQEEIEALQIAQSARSQMEPWPYLAAGDAVRIAAGPLAGRQGIVVTVKGSTRLVLSVTMLQRSVLAEIDRSWLV
jgi:transcription termination/antitermination protein NusG